MRNKMTIARLFIIVEGNRNIKIREALMAEEVDLPLERSQPKLAQRQELFAG